MNVLKCLTISNVKHVVKHLKSNDNWKPQTMRQALATIREWDLDFRTINYDGHDHKTVITALDCDGAEITLRYRANSSVAYVLAGLGGAY